MLKHESQFTDISMTTFIVGITPQRWTNKDNTGGASRGGGGDAGGAPEVGGVEGANKQCPFYKKMPGTEKISLYCSVLPSFYFRILVAG